LVEDSGIEPLAS